MPLTKIPEQIPGASIGPPMRAHAGMVDRYRASRQRRRSLDSED